MKNIYRPAVLFFLLAFSLLGPGACSSNEATSRDAQDGLDGLDGSDGADGNPCAGKVCENPPANFCRDGLVLVIYDAKGVCQPQSGECFYPTSEMACPYGCQDGRCAEVPPDRVVIAVPPGTQLCKSLAWDGDSVEYTWRTKFRLTLKEGNHLIPFNPASSDYEMIELAEVATAPEVLRVGSPGRFTSEWSGQAGESELHLRFRQSFSGSGSQQYALDMEFIFQAEDGKVTNPVLVLDERNLTRGPRFTGTFTHEYSSHQIISCSTELLEERRRVFQMQNGDVLRLRSRGWIELFGHPIQSDTFIGGLVEATFSRGQQVLSITDYFDLASGINHHGSAYSYWVHLDNPLGNVSDLTIDEFSGGQFLFYLDSQGNVIDQQPWQEVP